MSRMTVHACGKVEKLIGKHPPVKQNFKDSAYCGLESVLKGDEEKNGKTLLPFKARTQPFLQRCAQQDFLGCHMIQFEK